MKLPQTDSKGWLMKGFDFGAECVRRTRPEPIGSVVKWARRTRANPDCQEAIDAKAFTGRGSLRDLRQLVASLDSVEARMEALSTSSKAIPDVGMYLVVHRRHSNGHAFLRWRERTGASRHLPWDEVEALSERLPPTQRRWCAEASQRARQLNGEHLALREAIKGLRLRRATTQSHLYARSIPQEVD